MKHTFIVLILTLVLSLFIVGCQPTPELPDNDGADDVTADPDNGNEKKDDNTSNPKEDDKTGESIDHSPKYEDKSEENNSTEPEKDSEPEENPEAPPATETEPMPEVGIAVGNRFKDLTLSTMDGETINTADLRGKIVIVNLWASWCPPCKAELPDFDRIATEYKDQVVIIAADIDAGYGSAKSYVDQNFPDSDIIFAYDTVNNDAYRAAGGDGYVPYTAILDQNGVIVYTDSGALSHSALVDMIEKLLG